MGKTITITLKDSEIPGDALRHIAKLIDAGCVAGFHPTWTIGEAESFHMFSVDGNCLVGELIEDIRQGAILRGKLTRKGAIKKLTKGLDAIAHQGYREVYDSEPRNAVFEQMGSIFEAKGWPEMTGDEYHGQL